MGVRIGGKKKGYKAPHTLEAQEAKKRVIEKVSAEIDAIVEPQIKKAKKGNTGSFIALMDRAYGKPHQSVSGEEGGPIEMKITWGAPKQ